MAERVYVMTPDGQEHPHTSDHIGVDYDEDRNLLVLRIRPGRPATGSLQGQFAATEDEVLEQLHIYPPDSVVSRWIR